MRITARLMWLSVLLMCARVAGAQTPSPPLALAVTYADGRVTESVVGPNGFRAWTPMYPRVPGWTEPPGRPPVTAFNLVAAHEGETLRVWVSVLRGPAREVNEPIAEIVVGVDAPVVVDDLRRVGLMPVAFAAKRFVTPALPVPLMQSRVEGLEIEGVEPVLEPTPGYLITVRNRTEVPLVTLAFSTFTGGRPALSGQQGEPSAIPVVAPGGTFTFRLGASPARRTGQAVATSEPLDDVVLTGAIWADGRLGGDRSRVAPLLAVHRGRLEALRPVIEILRARSQDGDALAALDGARQAIARMPFAADAVAVSDVMRLVAGIAPNAAADIGPAMTIGSQNVRQRLLTDIDRVRLQLTPAEARQWLGEALPACEEWLARLLALFPER